MKSGTPVSQDEWLYRRGRIKHLTPNGDADSRVFALKVKDENKLSVEVKSLTTPLRAIRNPGEFNLFELPNNRVISLGLNTIHDPLEDGTEDAHALILGMTIASDALFAELARISSRVYDFG